MSSRSLRRNRRKIAASALAATLGLAGLGLAAPPAGASEPTDSARVEGTDRYGTAVAVSQATFPDGATDVVLARGDVYADALAGNGVAGALDAPILLTPSDSLDARTAAEIERLGAENVWIMGGTAAISQAVENTLDDDYEITRVEGVTRIETAVDAMATIDELTGIGETNEGQQTAILVNGFNFPDAVAASPAAYNLNVPVLLTTPNELSESTAAALEASEVNRVLVVGGTAAVSAATMAEVDEIVLDVERFSGETRYSTATDFAQEFLLAELGWDGPEYDLVTGQTFPDALTAGPHAGTIEAPVVLTTTDSLAADAEAFLTTNCEIFDEQIVVGGTAAVSAATASAAAAAAQCDGTAPGDVTVTVASTTVNPGGTITGTITGEDIQGVTVSGCGFNNQTVTRDANGGFTLSVPANAQQGACTLTFTTTFTDGTTETDTVDITIGQAQSPIAQAFTVTPAETAINTVSTAPGTANAARGARQYSVAIPSGTTAVDIALIPEASLVRDASGAIVGIRDTDNNNRADAFGVTPARFDVVNGAPTGFTDGPAGDVVSNVQVINGQVTFTVNSQTPNTAVVPVVISDANNNDQLDLDANDRPTEALGFGGLKFFLPEEATFGTYVYETVALALPFADVLSTCDPQAGGANPNPATTTPGPGDPCGNPQRAFRWDSGDQFTYTSGTGGPVVTITQPQFEEWLSGYITAANVCGSQVNPANTNACNGAGVRGDVLTVNYNPGGVSSFQIARDVPQAPSNVVATSADTDNDGSMDDVSVTWNRPTNPDISGYVVYRANVVNGTVGTFFPVQTQALDAQSPQFGGQNLTYNDQNVAPGTYAYIALAFNSFNDLSPNSASPTLATRVTVPTAAANAPFSVSSDLDQCAFTPNAPFVCNAAAAGDPLQPGDRITFNLNQPITVAANASVVVRDDEGDAARLTNGSNATFVVGGLNSNQLIIDVTGTPVPTATRVNQFVNMTIPDGDGDNDPVVVESSTGITTGGLDWNLPESGRADCQPSVGPNQASPTCGTAPNNTRARVFSLGNAATNAELPDALDPGDITINTANDTVRINPGVTEMNNNEPFTVFGRQGNVIAQGTYSAANGTTVTVNPGIEPGDPIYVVYLDVQPGGGPGNSNPGVGQPSASLRVDIPTDAPIVTNVFGTGNTIQVQWSEQVLQTGPPANYQVFNATNSVLVATGTATNPPTGSVNPAGTVVVTLSAPLTTGNNYFLRVAPVTVHDLQNNPNPQETDPFTAAPVAGAIDIQSGPCANDTSDDAPLTPGFQATEPTIQTDATPTFTGTAQAQTPGTTVSEVRVTGPGTPAGGTQATITNGAGTSNVSFAFTPTALPQGTNVLTFTVRDTANPAGTATFQCTLTVDTVAPTVNITAPLTTTPVGQNEGGQVTVEFTSSETGTYVIEGTNNGTYQTLSSPGFFGCFTPVTGGATGTAAAAPTNNTVNICVPDLADTDWLLDLRVRVTDPAGLTGQDEEFDAVDVDDQDAPTILDIDRVDNDTVSIDFSEPTTINTPGAFELRSPDCSTLIGTGTAVAAGTDGTTSPDLDLTMAGGNTVTSGVQYCLVVTATNAYSDTDDDTNDAPATAPQQNGPFTA